MKNQSKSNSYKILLAYVLISNTFGDAIIRAPGTLSRSNPELIVNATEILSGLAIIYPLLLIVSIYKKISKVPIVMAIVLLMVMVLNTIIAAMTVGKSAEQWINIMLLRLIPFTITALLIISVGSIDLQSDRFS